MLAQNFMAACDLDITKAEFSALQKTLVMLETGKIVHAPIGDGYYPNQGPFTGQFNMCHWNSAHDCGTIACIGGTAELIGNVRFNIHNRNRPNNGLYRLFMPDLPESIWNDITPAQAATALRSYLTTGDADWPAAMARSSRETASE